MNGRTVAWLGLALSVSIGWSRAGVAQETISFNRHIRPILADKCLACHGQDGAARQADLRLDTREGATADLGGRQAIRPGDPDNSELWLRITSGDESLRMPPADAHKALDETEITLLRQWIEQGAAYQGHWAFEPVQAVAPPAAETVHAVDAFLNERLKTEGLVPATEAERSILIRRVSFALTGLPPSRAEVAEWLADEAPGAYERMVDRYLASVHYGEEMARHWLDLARYGDTHGLHLDNERQMWAYRDWVVRSFNRNQPFDEFTAEQLAGDLLPEPTRDQLIATGFNRCNVTTSEGGAIDDEFRYRYAVDRASTTAQVWLGLTAGCAVCHDHKFDPISQREFYSLYAFFNSAADPAMDGNALLTDPVLKLESDADRAVLAGMDARLQQLRTALDARVAAVDYQDPSDLVPAPEPAEVETVWLEDEFPSGGVVHSGPGQGTVFVTVDQGERVFSGQRALKRTDAGLSQDVWEQAPVPLVIPASGRLFAHVFIDPADQPQSIMLQFFKGGWLHRAVWGDYDAIEWGTPHTTERVAMGELPATGEWVRLEVPAEKVGLAPGDQVTGFATTQFGGTVYWDKVGTVGVVDPARDPGKSWRAWWSLAAGKDTPELAPELAAVAKAGPEAETDPALRERLRLHYLARICETTRGEFAAELTAISQLEQERQQFFDAIPSTFIYRDLDSPRESFVMLRGQYDQPGEKVEPDVLAILPDLSGDPASRATRLDLARWMVRDDNPLTARVMVNRYWQQLFGTGLVKSSGDFGTQGELPSHPELLDWLATHFRESGWDVKGLVRLLVTSAAFRRDSAVPAGLLERDPENRLLARGPRLRLDAEQVRDNVLFVSGLLDRTVGGKGVRPYQPANIWEPVGYIDSNTRHYKPDSGPALYRRSLYTFFKRTAPPPFMVNFDAPNREQSCTRRERSNTPLQALQLLNDVQHVEAARHLAERAIRDGAPSANGRIGFLYQTVLAREPDPAEVEVLAAQLKRHQERYAALPDDARRLVALGESRQGEGVDAVELAAWTLLASTVLNLDETVNRN